MSTKETPAQMTLLQEIKDAGDEGMVVPGTKGTTARRLRELRLVEYVGDPAIVTQKPISQRITAEGLATLAHYGPNRPSYGPLGTRSAK